jgi:hypothetical protein
VAVGVLENGGTVDQLITNTPEACEGSKKLNWKSATSYSSINQFTGST